MPNKNYITIASMLRKEAILILHIENRTLIRETCRRRMILTINVFIINDGTSAVLVIINIKNMLNNVTSTHSKIRSSSR